MSDALIYQPLPMCSPSTFTLEGHIWNLEHFKRPSYAIYIMCTSTLHIGPSVTYVSTNHNRGGKSRDYDICCTQRSFYVR